MQLHFCSQSVAGIVAEANGTVRFKSKLDPVPMSSLNRVFFFEFPQLETASRVQGLLSDDIVFEKSGPQSDPWLKSMESLQTAEYVHDHTKNGSK